MGIDNFDVCFEKVTKVLDNVGEFCASHETENRLSIARGEISNEINSIVGKIKKINTGKNKREEVSKEKTIGYLYKNSINFLPNDKTSDDFPLLAGCLQNLIFTHKNEYVVHHLHVTGKIVGYALEYCNLQTRENYYTIPVFAHNQFRFDFFLFLKGLRASVWETTEISIGRKNPTDVNFAIVQNQVRFIDTVKYYQQSLASLAASMTDTEKENVRKNCMRFLGEKLMFLNNEQEKWILDYLSSGKGMIPYQMITEFSSLEIKPKDGFFNKRDFYLSLKEKDISTEEYENVKKFFNMLKL